MKALILRGLFRSFEETYKMIIKNHNLENEDFHVFITTSNYNNKKYRFKKISDNYFNIDILKEKIKNIVGINLKHLEIMDESKFNNGRIDKYIRSINNFIEFKQKNNVKYDHIIQHRMDVVFVNWEIADKYYEDRKVGEKREKGILKISEFNFPIGVKNHGCCCIQACPKIEETCILKFDKLKDDEIYCYEDYHIGHDINDYLITNDNIDFLKKQKQFWIDYTNGKLLSLNNKFIEFNNTKSIQSYDYINKDWLSKMWSKSFHYQYRLFMHMNNIKIKSLRYEQDCAVLYIR